MEGVESAKVFSGKVSLPNSNNVNLSGPLITAAKVFNNNNDAFTLSGHRSIQYKNSGL